MRRLDEIITRIEEEELYSGLESQELLSEAPLTEREAKKLFEQVRAKKEGKAPKPRRKTKKIFAILAAAVVAALGLTAAAVNIWPVLFSWGNVSGEYYPYTAAIDNGWDEKDLEAYAEAGEIRDLQAFHDGITVRINRLFYSGNTTIADIDIITPHKGVSFGEADKDWYPGFKWEEAMGAYRALNNMSFGGMNLKESDDPTDNVLSMWMVFFTSEYNIIGKDFSLDAGFVFSDLRYLDGNGNKIEVLGDWKFEWKLDNPKGIRRNLENPIKVSDLQSIQSYRISNCTVAIQILLDPEKMEDAEPQMYAPVIELRDGTKFEEHFPSANNNVLVEASGIKSQVTVLFPYPVELDEIKSIRYGPIEIPVNS